MGMIANGELGLSVRTAINNIALGHIRGVYPVYTDTTHVAIQPGQVECNSNTYILTTAVAHEILNFSSGGFTYLYIDDSESTKGGTPTIIDSTTEPAWSDSKQGYYNGNDRCIGALYCDGAATLSAFTTQVKGTNVWVKSIATLQIAAAMNPDSTWQAPGTKESSTVLPVNAILCNVVLLGSDAAGQVANISCCSYEASVQGLPVSYQADVYNQAITRICDTGEITLGASRNIRIAGDNDDDNALYCWVTGYTIRR